MIVVELFSEFAQVYSDSDKSIRSLFSKIENQRSWVIFNICEVDDNKIVAQEYRGEEIIGFLEYQQFLRLREGLYFSDKY